MATQGEPTVRLRLTRDSVCMADDIDAPHERDVEVLTFTDPVVLVTALLGYLPYVGGSGHSWTCALNDQPIATIEGNGGRVRAETQEVIYSESNHVHLSYSSAPW